MESIEQMIKRLCPEGVKFVKLLSVCNVIYGYPFESAKFTDDSTYIPLIRIRDVVPGKASTYYEGEILEDYIIKSGDILVGMDGNFNLAKWQDRDGLLNQRVCKFYSKDEGVLLTSFAFHFLKPLFKKIENEIGGSTVKHLSAAKIKEIQIPLPPMEVQNRIVEILDKMTTLTAELEAELEARKQQYEYYRNKLLTFNELGGIERVNWKKISEIGVVMRGTSFQKKHFTDDGTPCIHYGQIYTQYAHHVYETISFVGEEISRSPRRAKTGALVMATTSENIEDVGKCVVWLGEEDIIVSNDACFIQHSLNPKYLGYLLQTDAFANYKKKVATGTKVIRINADAVADFVIPVPSMEEQERIVSILDRFEALTTDLQSGLPAEIEARRQQYEYYRNKLLTFKQAV